MSVDLAPFKAAVTACTDAELRAVVEASRGVRDRTAPKFLAWIEHACEWELSHRGGFDYALQVPEEAIPPEEDAFRIDAVLALRAAFVGMSRARSVFKLFDLLANLIASERRRG